MHNKPTLDFTMSDSIHYEIENLLTDFGVHQNNIDWSAEISLLLIITIATFITTKAFRHIVIPMIHKITAKTKATWDDYLFNNDMMKAFCRIIPPIMLYALLPMALHERPYVLGFLLKACLIYINISMLVLISTFLKSLYKISSENEKLKNRPLKGIYQMINLIAIIVGIIIIISILLDRNPISILAGLGASAAILMLVFKDTLLGLVAGVQLSANDMLRPGDWITMPKYGADGNVIEVSLTTIKVQNFDKTITTIPPYALVSDSFQNWRGMKEAGGRRIKRFINIDINTIHFLSDNEKRTLIDKGLIGKQDISDGNEINLALFRTYILRYLTEHSKLNKEFTVMVRQLQPTSEGLPLEIYCFTNTTVWPEYENIQSEIFEHIIASSKEFDLRLYQKPSGNDFKTDF